MKDYREISLWKNVTPEEWNDWHWQLANRITDIETLGEIITLTSEEKKALNDDLLELRMAITPYYATLMDPKDVNCPIRMQAVPTSKERNTVQEDFYDPLAEDRYAPVPGFVHRYPDRGILLVTDQCSMYCRFCTRRRFAGEVDRPKSREEIQAAIDYIERTPVLRDVLITGGDPLTMEDDNLEWLLASLRRIPHVEIIRIGTRVPAVMPQRITSSLTSMLKQFHPLWINVHFNHPKEITPYSTRALNMLADAGIPLGNQSVLLRGINDCPYIFKELFQKLLMNRVRPYYIYQCDLSRGISHFRTSVGKGIEIIEFLRGHTTGMAVPTFVIDAPGGGGKIPLMPNYLLAQGERRVVLRNFEGTITVYTEPEDASSHCHGCTDICLRQSASSGGGVSELLEGSRLQLEPQVLKREERRHQWMEEKKGQSVHASDHKCPLL